MLHIIPTTHGHVFFSVDMSTLLMPHLPPFTLPLHDASVGTNTHDRHLVSSLEATEARRKRRRRLNQRCLARAGQISALVVTKIYINIYSC